MIFADNNYYGLISTSFINDYNICYAWLDGIIDGNKLSPLDSCAIDKSKIKALIKTFNEHSERFLLGYSEDKYCVSINFINNNLEKLHQSYFSYGNSEVYGHSDTTGTASGLSSKFLIKKAVLELLEKNEMFLFWYAQKGYVLNLESYILSNYSLDNYVVYVFLCAELSNYYTVFTILRHKDRIISSGVGISNNIDESISISLNEAILLKLCHEGNPNSIFYKIPICEHLDIVNHIETLKCTLPVFDYKSAQIQNELKINSFIKGINFKCINRGFSSRRITIKCISKELLNSIPNKNNINTTDFSNKEIMRLYGVDAFRIKQTPNCILL